MDFSSLIAMIPTAWVPYVSAVVAIASIVAALFPQGAEGTVWYYARKVIDALALNFGNAKNESK